MSLDFITQFERFECTKLVRKDFIKDAWIVGGSLNRKDSKDIDIIVKTKEPICATDIDAMTFGSFEVKSIHDQYLNECPQGSIKDKDLIVKLWHPKMRDVDLLFVSSQMDVMTIKDYMRVYFPLSIQMRAVSLFTWDGTGLEKVTNWITGSGTHIPDIPDGIVVAKPNIDDDYFSKYRSYFPSHTFLFEAPCIN